MAREYTMSPKAKAQRKQAALVRWEAMGTEQRKAALQPAFSVTPGGPGRGHKVRPKRKNSAK